ncbi:MAG TPA: hydrogenase maturation protease [Candidatus Sulfotelmatobacter sp.]|nr:hydrogenase maturation protease [Candidatus Sulfotelmatobacter sp.]
MPRVLIFAFGNPLRSDDRLAWRAADVLAAKYSVDEVEVVTLHQLGPELAESVSRSGCVIFVDAAAGPGRPGDVRITQLSATSASSDAPGFCHAVSPSHVLALAAQLYNVRPRAYSATLVGKNFDHGESLSAPVKAAIPELVVRIDELVQKFINNKGQEVARRKT